uniref:hypothetical protein n=1 Tax=Fulvivirga sp. TaxID=1931237 RepID=UPI004049148F
MSKVYDNENDKLEGGTKTTYVDDFPILGSDKSICYKSEKPISKMISSEVF